MTPKVQLSSYDNQSKRCNVSPTESFVLNAQLNVCLSQMIFDALTENLSTRSQTKKKIIQSQSVELFWLFTHRAGLVGMGLIQLFNWLLHLMSLACKLLCFYIHLADTNDTVS